MTARGRSADLPLWTRLSLEEIRICLHTSWVFCEIAGIFVFVSMWQAMMPSLYYFQITYITFFNNTYTSYKRSAQLVLRHYRPGANITLTYFLDNTKMRADIDAKFMTHNLFNINLEFLKNPPNPLISFKIGAVVTSWIAIFPPKR